MPIAIAHRGDPLHERENTMAAFRAAVRAGADMVELDLQRCRDGEIVVLHDPTLQRLWGIERSVAELDAAALRAIGEPGRGIPALREVLEEIALPLMIDFTSSDVVEGALGVVRDARAMERALFVTGNVPALRILRALAPEARVGLTWTQAEPPSARLLEELDAEYWNPAFFLVTPDWVEEMHGRGRRVSTWTVDEPQDMGRMVAAGVDAIVSNRIVELRRLVSAAP